MYVKNIYLQRLCLLYLCIYLYTDINNSLSLVLFITFGIVDIQCNVNEIVNIYIMPKLQYLFQSQSEMPYLYWQC